MSLAAEPFSDPVAFHGEGPVWHAGWGGLRFVDMLAGDVVCLDQDGRVTDRIHLSDVAAAYRPRSAGGMVAGSRTGSCSSTGRVP